MSADLPLRIEGLTFRYHTRPELALQDVSLTVEPGELLLVAGASGCGKTTLIRCINGLIPRTYRGELQGRVLVYGQDARSMSMAQLSQQVGTLLQDPERQIVGSFVLNEVAFGLENLGLPREEIRARVDEVLAYLGISHLRDRETFHLSGGEKQKVALAGVLAMRPGILLLDEPLASLDPVSAQEALALFRRLGLPDKVAFSMDLAFRFVPTLARDFSLTLDAQRARGYEVEKLSGGLIAQIRKMAPLIVPVTINAIVGAEDIVNAMDLRCFGLRPRTWLQELRYTPRDYALIAFSVAVLVGSTLARALLRVGDFWVPDVVLRFFGF